MNLLKKVWFILLGLLIAGGIAFASTYTGTTVPDLVETTPIGATDPVSDLDDAIQEIKKAIKRTYYDWASLTNKTGSTLVVGDVVAIDTATASGVVAVDTQSSARIFVVAVEAPANNAAGLFAHQGVVTAKVTGAITIGNYLRKSATASALEDTGTATANSPSPPLGSVALALDSSASGTTTKKVYLFGRALDLIPTGRVADNAITYAKIQNATSSTLLGHLSASTGNIENLTGTQATTLLDVVTSTLKGLAPSSGGGTTNFLRADATWAAPSAGLSAATQAEMESATSNTVAATPGRTQYHPGVAKVWAQWTLAGVIDVSYNTTSITDTGAGDWTLNIDTDFSSANYVISVVTRGSTAIAGYGGDTRAAGSFQVNSRNTTGTLTDPTGDVSAVAFGDQ